jgi:hypothetical protein
MNSEPTSPSLGARVHAVWRRTQRNHLANGFLVFFRWGVPLFLAAMTFDWLVDLPPVGRLALLLIIIALPTRRAWKSGWSKLKKYDAGQTAMAIEEKEGGLESLLATAVEFEKNGPTPGTSASLWEATCQNAEEAAGGLDPVRIASFRNLARPAGAALALALLMIVFALINGRFLGAGLTRIFNPWALAAYPTNTLIEAGQGNLVVKQGERATLEIAISGVVPETATLLLQTGEGEPRELELVIIDGKCQYPLASASRDFRYRIKAGDAKSDWFDVDVIPAPRISSVKVNLEFPDYLDRQKETREALTLAVPESTKIHWELSLDQPVRSAVLHRDDQDPMPLEVLDGGTRLIIDEKVEASRGYSFSWIEKAHDFEFTSPRYFLQVSADQAPQVEISSPESNLSALLGRKLDLAVRVRDDHGIGSTKILYRVNLRPAKTVELNTPLKNGEGEQQLAWDYREALPDLKVGDTVSFIVEVADRYPGPDGPHLARSETRRLNFLSRDEYLAQVKRKQDRLLTRVRNVYRQERAAHELVRDLDSAGREFRQTCQLEAIRQEMLREQLKETAREVQNLLDDLAANNVTEAVEKDALLRVKSGIVEIAEKRIARAADFLRQQAGQSEGKIRPAIEMVNLAARELAQLVLLRGIDSAREVFARETHMFAREQAELRLLTIQNNGDPTPERLAARHQELARWTGELMASLRKGMRYQKRPISVLQLTRRIDDLATGSCLDQLSSVGPLITEGKPQKAATIQSNIIKSFLQAEFSMRSGAEYAAILDFRKTLSRVRQEHEALQASCQAMKPEDFKKHCETLAAEQEALRNAFVPALLPPVPTPRARLFDTTLPAPPPVDSLRLAAEEALSDAFTQLKKGSQQAALSQQIEATQNLAKLDLFLKEATVELGLRTSGLTSLVSNANERVALIEDFEARQISLLEKTEEAALDEVDSAPLAEPQSFLLEEVTMLINELTRVGEKNKEVLPLIAQLQQLSKPLKQATERLKSNNGEEALDHQEQAADLLALLLEVAQAQVSRLTILQDLYQFQRAVGNASGWMKDIVAEQNELIAITRKEDKESTAALIARINNLRQCLVEIAPVLDLVAGRLDAGTPLLFAGTDLEDAVLGIEDGDFLDAEDAQTVASESLAKVQGLVSAVESQTGYTAEIVEFIHRAQAEATLTSFRQSEIRKKLALGEGEIPEGLVDRQEALMKRTMTLADSLNRATGMPPDSLPSGQMERAVASLKSGQPDEASDLMGLAEEALTSHAEELFLIITMLQGLPAIEITNASDPELVLLVDVLAIASDQRNLSRITEATAAAELDGLVKSQETIMAASARTLKGETPDERLARIQRNLSLALPEIANKAKSRARQYQDLADDLLRHYVIGQALALETAKALPAPSDEPVLSENETDDLYESTANFVSDFVSGEAPKNKRTEWEVLGNRNRAALNQNFARELPLEYRALLKNYYERIAK